MRTTLYRRVAGRLAGRRPDGGHRVRSARDIDRQLRRRQDDVATQLGPPHVLGRHRLP